MLPRFTLLTKKPTNCTKMFGSIFHSSFQWGTGPFRSSEGNRTPEEPCPPVWSLSNSAAGWQFGRAPSFPTGKAYRSFHNFSSCHCSEDCTERIHIGGKSDQPGIPPYN